MKNYVVSSFLLERKDIYCEYFVDRVYKADLVWSSKYSIKVRVSPNDGSEFYKGAVVIANVILCIKDVYRVCGVDGLDHYCIDPYSSLDYEDYFDSILDDEYDRDNFVSHYRKNIYKTLFYDLFEDIICTKDDYYLDDEGRVYNDLYEILIEKVL